MRRRREAILERETDLRLFVRDRLAEGWTPEQISGWLKSGNEPRLRAIGCEIIYAFIYRTAQKAEALWRYLTRRHKRRRPRRARASRDTIKDRASIHDRPKTIESRGEAGHWEGDLIRQDRKLGVSNFVRRSHRDHPLGYDGAVAVTTASPEPEPSPAGPRNSPIKRRRGKLAGA